MNQSTTTAAAHSLAAKYRPAHFTDLIFEDQQTKQHLTQYACRQRYGHIILHGAYGVAKSLTAKLLIDERQRRINSPNMHMMAFHGSMLAGNVASMLNQLGFHHLATWDDETYILLDEADQIPMHDQLVLRYLMDEMRICRLIMTTNNLPGIDGGIRNRSHCIEMKMPAPNDWLARAQHILRSEGVMLDDLTVLNLLQPHTSFRTALRSLENVVVSTHRSATSSAVVVPPSQSVSTPAPMVGGTVAAGSSAASIVPPVATVPFSVMPTYSYVQVQTAVVPAPSNDTP